MKRKNRPVKRYMGGISWTDKIDVRKPAINEDRLEDLVKYIAEGNFLETACALVGVSVKLIRRHLDEGSKLYDEWEKSSSGIQRDLSEQEQLSVNLFVSVQRAMAEAEAEDVKQIRRGSKRDWHASKFRLEASNPSKWKVKDKVEVEHGGKVKVVFKMPRKKHQKEDGDEK